MVTFQRLLRLGSSVGLVGFVLALAACNEIGGIHKATLRDCVVVSDCMIDASECRSAVACNDGTCVFDNAPDGKPIAQQSIGDCAEIVCDGAGGIKSRDTPADIVGDGDPCTIDKCIDGKPTHQQADEVPCYEGPRWTRNVGICADGIQKCVNGLPDDAGCEGQVLPKVEYCDEFLQDEDCDGHANNEGIIGCVCKPGDIVTCYTGKIGTENLGICHDGKTSCNEDGRGYGPCIGEQTPLIETCDSLGFDDDCDGHIDEEGAGCYCGDSTTSMDIEECDDGNGDSTDACTTDCKISKCGDGVVQAVLGESCDDGNLDPTDSCTAECQPAMCGDGITQPGHSEECDDGNLDSTDECTIYCQRAACGDGFIQANEMCDDGNTVDGDGCPSRCRPAIEMVSAGNNQTCAVFSGGILKCWGRILGITVKYDHIGDEPNEMGQFLSTLNVGTNKTVRSVAVGERHTCAILNDDTVKCWGQNESGQLGLGDGSHRGIAAQGMSDLLPTVDLGTGKSAKAISVGGKHTCAILNDDTVKCWGYNGGQLGLGDLHNRGDAPDEMGDALPAVDLGSGKTAKAISAGDLHTCAILNDNSVKCWGDNDAGQLGLGDDVTRGDNPGEMGDALPVVDLGTGKTATAIATRYQHTCAILHDKSLKCWGLNDINQLGRSCLTMPCSIGDEPGEMGDALPTVDLGSNAIVAAVSAGGSHTCALLQDSGVKCWGSNGAGVLGQGDSMPRGLEGTMGDALAPVNLGMGKVVVYVASGAFYNCAILDDATLKCWGRNYVGELGLGDTLHRGSLPVHMGDNLPVVLLW